MKVRSWLGRRVPARTGSRYGPRRKGRTHRKFNVLTTYPTNEPSLPEEFWADFQD